MPRIAANGIQVHYVTAGAGPDVVMIHGFLGNLAAWHARFVPYFRNDFRVTTYDLRGHGYSDLTPNGYSAREMAADLEALLDALHISKAAVIGYSLGADIALYFAHQSPDRVTRVVAVEPGLAALAEERANPLWPGWDAWVRRLESSGVAVPEDRRSDPEYLLELSILGLNAFGPVLFGGCSGTGEPAKDHLSLSRTMPRKRAPLLKLVRETTMLRDYHQVDGLTLDALREIRTPVLLVYGNESPFLPAGREIRKRLPNCQPVILSGTEHFGPLEMPDSLAESILAFLREELTFRPCGDGCPQTVAAGG